MVTVTLDEITLNAVRAALDERVKRLDDEVAYWQSVVGGTSRAFDDSGFDTGRALVWSVDALLQTEQAREFFSEVSIEPEQSASWTTA